MQAQPTDAGLAPRLICQESLQTGLPHLVDPTGQVSEAALAAAQREVAQRYERLVAQDGAVTSIPSLAELGLPANWKVTVRFEPGRRCPTLWFDPAEPPGPPTSHHLSPRPGQATNGAAASPADWRRRWLEEASRVCRARARTPEDWRRLEELLAEISALADDKPAELGLLLLAGYLRVADAISQSGQPGECPANRGRAQALARVCEGFLPSGAVEVDSCESDSPRRSWLSRVLGRQSRERNT